MLFGVSFFMCVTGRADTTSPPVVEDANIYAIYDAVLVKYIVHKKDADVSIVETTDYEPPFVDCSLNAHESGQWKSALADFEAQNKITHSLTDKFHLPFRYKLVDKLIPVGGARMPPKGVPFDVFLKQQLAELKDMIKNHRSQVQVSVPGVSLLGDLAIVYMANSFSGGFWVLRKHGVSWEVKGPACSWMS